MSYGLVKGFLDALAPVENITVSEWSDKYRKLSSTASAEPGDWRTDRTPYLREIMDKLSSFDEAEEVICMKAAQLGLTEMGFNLMGYTIDVDPGPMLYVLPTTEMVKRNSKTRFDPMIEATERLHGKIKPSRAKDSGNTIFHKDFPGGSIILTGANSAAPLRNAPIRTLILDEVDAYPANLNGEGSPVELAKARTRTFSRRKIFQLSTPLISGTSAIESAFDKTDQRYFFVPCLKCSTLQTLKFPQLKWEKGKPKTVKYRCEHCGEMIEERYKTKMLASGRWIPTKPENETKKRYGYHINSLYSPYGWRSWEAIVEDFEAAENDVNKLRTFVNTDLAETWKEKGEAPPWEQLYNRREHYKLNRPNTEVCFITAGADVQKDRIEVEIVGWCRGRTSYSLDYRVFLGDVETSKPWDELAKVINESWEREDGIMMPLSMIAIDTGYASSTVYDFCRKFDAGKVFPIKGQGLQATIIGAPKSVDTSRDGKKAGKVRLWHVGVSLLKSELYGWLRLNNIEGEPTPAGFCHFPQYDQTYFRGITAEEKQFKIKNGYRKYEWVKKYDRNEPLDCRIYARAAAALFGIDRFTEKHYAGLLAGYEKQTKADKGPKKEPQKRKSEFWDD